MRTAVGRRGGFRRNQAFPGKKMEHTVDIRGIADIAQLLSKSKKPPMPSISTEKEGHRGGERSGC
jgi:hypothetical protein